MKINRKQGCGITPVKDNPILRKFCENNNQKSQVFAGDITENIMGSTGIAGAVNEIFLLDRKTGDDKAKLIATGHNMEQKKLNVEDLENLQPSTSEREELSGSEEEPNEVDEIKELEEIELDGSHEAVDF